MAFELKVIEKTTCPRCNALAQIRIDVRESESNIVLAYVVCKHCRLKRYLYTTTPKAIKYIKNINRLERNLSNLPENDPIRSKLIAKINYMKKLKERAEIGFYK